MTDTGRPDFYGLIDKNRRTTWLLLFAFFLLLSLVGVAISAYFGGGIPLTAIAVGVSATMAFLSYRSSDTLALRSTRAVPANREEFQRLNNLVEEVAIAAGVPAPRIYVVHDPAPNAFATGRNPEHAVIAVTTGLIDKMNRDELQGVIAHEMAHIRNYDIRVMTVAVATAGSIALIADIFWRLLYFGQFTGGGASRRGGRGNNNDNGGNVIAIIGMVFVAMLAPLAAAMLKAAISRQREELADASAIEFTRNPSGLRSALEKLDADITVVKRTSHATSHLWIEEPDDTSNSARGKSFNKMFNTHPPLADRINLLRSMEGLPPYEGPRADVAEALRTWQDDRQTPASAAAGSLQANSAQPSVAGLDPAVAAQIFGNIGEVAHGEPDVKAGWYRAPSGEPGVLQYWDGQEWTGHLHHIPSQNSLTPDGARRSSTRRRDDRRRGRRSGPQR